LLAVQQPSNRRELAVNTLVLAAVSALLLPGFVPGGSAETGPSPQEEVTVTILFDNYSADDRLGTGWGFAALIEIPGHTVLFDTGADGAMLLENMRLMGKDPMAIESVVLSHAHADHTGGLRALLDMGLRPKLFLLSAFRAELGGAAAGSQEVVEASPGQQIAPGIRTTGQVGEAIPEQALVLETEAGTVVLTGCAHPGVVRMVERAREVAPGPIHLVMGGFHLGGMPEADVRTILERFSEMAVERAGPTHCTGDPAIASFRDEYGDRYQPVGVGRVLRFSP
jgi:7,8-dihydropterin-6-yl-methyl-4-(beta-D-ribofuranosyl)aminobenzene 5'-phosphate synthase